MRIIHYNICIKMQKREVQNIRVIKENFSLTEHRVESRQRLYY